VRWPPAWVLVNCSSSAVAGHSPDSNDVSTEAEGSPLLRSDSGKRLVVWKVWRLAIVLQLLVVTICKWPVNPVSNPHPVCWHSCK
jgi:hypothetical protein